MAKVQDSETERAVTDIQRGNWGHKAEFLLSCIGLSVGLGNVWRFPYLAYKHGGATFLLAYLILQLTVGKPMYFMELSMGQYSGKGTVGVWEMNPSGRGIGISMNFISLFIATYYSVIMAYTLYYFFASMQATLPWSTCEKFIDHEDICISHRLMCTGNISLDRDGCICIEDTEPGYNISCINSANSVTAPALYFQYEMTQLSAGLEPENIGTPVWSITLCLLLAWIIVVACLYRGIETSGKVVYFTATFPYIILIVLLIRGCTLEGSSKGIEKFIVPDWNKFSDFEMWVDAAGQMFFSLGVCMGGIIMFGSFNGLQNDIYIDSLIISALDLVTSVISGFVIFSVLGVLSHESNVEIDHLAKSGFNLAFVVYPEALARLPFPQLWSTLFFFMLFILGLDSEFALLETVLSSLKDKSPILRKHKELLCVSVSFICFLGALPCTCPGGPYVIDLLDGYCAGFSLLCVASCELIAVMWVYGARRFLYNVREMIGYHPHPGHYWIFCWTVVAPIILSMLCLYKVMRFEPPKYANNEDFPLFAQAIGWVLLSIILGAIPANAIYTFARAKGSITERIRTITTPTEKWGPSTN